jgi:ribonuclease HI
MPLLVVEFSCGGIFRNCNAQFLGCFPERLNVGNSFCAELCGIMRTLEIARQINYSHLWLETDSKIAVLAFKNAK